MDVEAFAASLTDPTPPAGLSSAVEALWWDGKEDWHAAHDCLQSDDSSEGAWVHAYLHRKEGDMANAGYWYRRAGQKIATGSLKDEWRSIAAALLS